jgi:hypothetical protein
MDEVKKDSELVPLLDNTLRTYSEVWGATVHFAQQGIVDEVGYWLGLWRIRRDSSWKDGGFDTQDDWLDELGLLPRYEGGCVRSVFFGKMKIIDELVDRGITGRMIVHALTQPTATERLLKNADKIPEGETVQTVLEATEDMNPTQSAAHVGEVLHLHKEWVGDLTYFTKQQKLILPICEEDEDLSQDMRKYPIQPISYEDAVFLSKTLRKHLEVT